MEGEMSQTLVEVEAAAPKERTSPQSSGWKWTAALVAIALCFGAAVALTWRTRGQVHTEKDDDLRHTLRQISMSKNVRAAIHLGGQYNAEFKTSAEWLKDVDHYHSEGGLELRGNEIVIPRDGLYFVYSQASFRVRCHAADADAADANEAVHLSHTVKRWSPSYAYDDGTEKSYETILHSIRTACEKTPGGDNPAEGRWFSAVYMGAVFSLKSGDTLKTVIEEKLLPDLDDDSGKTFFGVFAL